MFNKGDFNDSIDRWTLRFKYKELEERIRRVKEEQISGMNAHKIFLIGSMIVQVCLIFPVIYTSNVNENKDVFSILIVDIIIGIVSTIAEVIVHKFERLKHFRSFMISIGCSFSVLHYDSQILEVPGVLLGYASIL